MGSRARMAAALAAALLGSAFGSGAAQADVLEITGGAPPTTFVDGVDFREMRGSAATDVTAPLYAVDLTIPPGAAFSSTSGCEPGDFAGFPAGSIALIQRGSCFFNTKAVNAAAAGAVAVIVFNEGQPGRTDLFYGTAVYVEGPAAGEPAPIAVMSASFATGDRLRNGITDGATGLTVRLATDGISVNGPPVLSLPADITVDASGPSGAAVSYTATATDPDGTTAPTVNCTPASGSTFAVGQTTVDCVATDQHGGTATGSFLVTVRGSADQTQDLIDDIQASEIPAGAKSSLTAKLAVVRDAAARGNTTAACNGLQAFKREVTAQTPRIGVQTATELLEQADALAAVIGC